MLKSRSSVDIMQLLCFVDYRFDVGTLEKSDLSNNYFPLLLLFGKIVVSDVTDRLETSRKMYVFGIIWILYFGEPVELVLIFKIFIVELEILLSHLILFDLILNTC